MKEIKSNLNKVFLIIIYILIFFVFSKLLYNILVNIDFITDNPNLGNLLLNAIPYLILIISGCILLKNEIVTDYKKLNKMDAMHVFIMCTVGIVFAYVANYIGSLISIMFGANGQSENQAGINTFLTSEYGFLFIILTVFIGPVVEELVFRKSIHDVLRSYKLSNGMIIFISSLLFGLIHVVNGGDYMFIFPYLLMGVVLGGLEMKSKNIYPCIFVHIFINALASIINIIMSNFEGLLPVA